MSCGATATLNDNILYDFAFKHYVYWSSCLLVPNWNRLFDGRNMRFHNSLLYLLCCSSSQVVKIITNSIHFRSLFMNSVKNRMRRDHVMNKWTLMMRLHCFRTLILADPLWVVAFSLNYVCLLHALKSCLLATMHLFLITVMLLSFFFVMFVCWVAWKFVVVESRKLVVWCLHENLIFIR